MQSISKMNNITSSTLLIGNVDVKKLQKALNISDQDFFTPSDYTVAQMKDLIHFVNLKPYNSTKRLVVIFKAENLSLVSANTILKTLEEPPPDALIILTTLNERKILPTIISRCQKIRVDVLEIIEEPLGYKNPQSLSQLSVGAKFKWVESIIESGQIEVMLTLHQQYFRQELLNGKDVLDVLKKISAAKDLLGSNISVKLLLENLLLSYSVEHSDKH